MTTKSMLCVNRWSRDAWLKATKAFAAKCRRNAPKTVEALRVCGLKPTADVAYDYYEWSCGDGAKYISAIQYGLGDASDMADFKDGRTVVVCVLDYEDQEVRKFRSLKAMVDFIEKSKARLRSW